MANQILHKRNSVASTVPTAAQLTVGELAINTADGKVYTKKTDNSVVLIGPIAGGGTATIKTTTVAFGTVGIPQKTFTITDAAVALTNRIIAQIEFDTDEVEMGPMDLFCRAGTGQFTLLAQGIEGPVHGNYKVSYLIG